MSADYDRALEALIGTLVSEHAPHGFDGFMRSAKDGCQVYVAATALQNALRECTVEPPACDHPGIDHGPWSYTGICPSCGLCKWIGHGPLCNDCHGVTRVTAPAGGDRA